MLTIEGNGSTQSATCCTMCIGVEWGLGTRGLRMVAAFWAGIPIEITQKAGVILRCRRGVIGTPLVTLHIGTPLVTLHIGTPLVT